MQITLMGQRYATARRYIGLVTPEADTAPEPEDADGTASEGTAIAQLLVGSWVMRASNIPLWLSGERRSPFLSFAVATTHPLVLSEELSWTTADGERSQKLSIDHWDGTGFARRGQGLRMFDRSRWSLVGVNPERNILILRLISRKPARTGLELFVREGAAANDARSVVANSTARFGLTVEDFASLAWLDRG